MIEFLLYKISRYPDSVMNALSILIILITGQGCIANVLFTVLLGDNHPCKPENLKVGFYIEIVFPRFSRMKTMRLVSRIFYLLKYVPIWT